MEQIDRARAANLRIHAAIPISMIFNAARAKKSFQKLYKSLKPISRKPSPARVHNLRTRIRRVEALIHALMLDHERQGKRLLRVMTPIRKKAGKVRDIDVLIGFATTLSSKGEDECLIQLVEHLGSVRVQSVRKLRNAFSTHRKEARHHIEQCSALVEKQFPVAGKLDNRDSSAVATATALALWTELLEWPHLNARNLHPFRIKAKELRYILQLTGNEDANFIQALGQVKDTIGEWHDWNELATIAAGVLNHGYRCPLPQQLRSITKAKLQDALSTANALRKKYRNLTSLSSI